MPATTRKRKPRPVEEDEDEVTSESEEDPTTSSGEEEDDVDDQGQPNGGTARRGETPEQKRLRLAKAYLKSMEVDPASRGGEGEDGEGDDDDLGAAPSDPLAERLKVDALAQRGHYQRKVADRIALSSEGCLRLICRPMSRRGGGGFHRKPLTGVCIPAGEDTKCYSVSKCGQLVGWDLAKMRRDNAFTLSVRDAQRAISSGSASTSLPDGGLDALYAVCASDDGRLVVTGGHSGAITVWDARTGEAVKTFDNGHKTAVTGLTFQSGTSQLFSCGSDRTVKIWSLDDMAYVDTLFGHVQGCTQIDCLRKERVISVGEDRTLRLWKIQDETQLLFKSNANSGNVDSCCFVNGTTFVTGSQDNSVSLWTMFKKRPVFTVRDAHQQAAVGNPCRSWIHALAACPNTDLVASGSGDGQINLYRASPEAQEAAERFKPIGNIGNVEGYVNALCFNEDATILVAGVGQEPRLGRWDRNKEARNALFVQRLQISD